MIHPKPRVLAFSSLILALFAASPGTQAADAARLGAELTPLGAERAGNKDGSIPAWSGNEVQQSGWSYGKLRGEHFKHKDDKPTLTIDAANADKYAEHLSPGQLAMLKQIKGYSMQVYPTRRSCGAPDFVAANTKASVSTGKLAADGWGLKEATVPGIPFAMPATGIEAMWNAKMRYRGIGIDYKNVVTSVSPRSTQASLGAYWRM